MRVLLTNDDGVEAVGIRCLAEALRERHEVCIVAPEHEQSGVGHAFTFQAPLHYRTLDGNDGIETYAVSGTPSDCVKFGVSYLLRTRPDAVVSGMNIGENSGVSSIYSGTVAAAREGALWGIPSFAFSMAGTIERFAAEYSSYAARVLSWIMAIDNGALAMSRPRTFYNVNFPACPPGRCRGLRFTRQSLAFFDDRYRSAGVTARGEGFMLFGEKQGLEPSREYDSRALLDEYAVLTPTLLDCTDVHALKTLSAHGAPRLCARQAPVRRCKKRAREREKEQ